MLKLPEGFDFRGVYCYRNKDDPENFYILAGEPTPEKDALGRPTLALWVSNQGAMLQLGTWWRAEPDVLEELKKHIAEQFNLDSVMIRLSPAPVTIKGVTVALGDGGGKFVELQTTASSGYTPYAAIFNLQLTAEQKTQAVAALNGRTGFLTIIYRGGLLVDISLETSIAGDVREDVVALGENPSITDCLARIEVALAAGRLTLNRSGTTGAPDELLQKADRLAKQKAAALLQQMARGGALNLVESTLKTTVALTEKAPVPLERMTDVSSWFPDGGADHIHVLPTTVKDPPTPPAVEAVKLSFDATEAPIAFIEVTAGNAQATLRGPGFEPVTLAAGGAGKPLVVKSVFKEGGAPYETTLFSPGPEGWILAPKDLGLVRVLVDGAAPQAAGSTQARVTLHYEPSGKGTKDDCMIILRGKKWTDSWYLVTRSAGLDGVLEFSWTETTAKGAIVRHKSVTTDNPEINL